MVKQQSGDMKNADVLVEIGSTHSNPTHADRKWLDEAYGAVLCASCKKIKRSDYPKPVDVRLRLYNAGTVTGLTFWAGVTIFHRAFIEQIREHLDDFVLGRCYDMQGTLIDDYVTCYSREFLVIRAREDTQYYICKTCGSVSGSPGDRFDYILRRYLTGEKVMQTASGTMYLAPDLADQVDWSLFSHVSLTRVPIRDRPVDGQRLPGDPDWGEV